MTRRLLFAAAALAGAAIGWAVAGRWVNDRAPADLEYVAP